MWAAVDGMAWVGVVWGVLVGSGGYWWVVWGVLMGSVGGAGG